MARKILIAICLIGFLLNAEAQEPSNPPITNSSGWVQYKYIRTTDGTIIAARDTNYTPKYMGTEVWWQDNFWVFNGSKWINPTGVTGGGGGGETILIGGPFVTANTGIGFNPGTNITVSELVRKVWYGTKPTATLGGGITLELTNASTVSETLAWSATRQTGAPTLSTIVVAGVSQSFSQPSAGSIVSGTQNVSVPANVTTTYQNVVTASDAQVGTASTTFNFLGKKYYGVISDTTGIGIGTQDAAILALTNSFASTKALTINTGAIIGTEFWVYAYPASLGALSSLLFNSIPALDAMNTTTRSFTNSLGYTQSYIFYWNKQGQTTSSDITAQ